MTLVPDENDIVYDTYGLTRFLRWLYEKFIGSDWEGFVALLNLLWDIFSILALILALLFFLGFLYANIRIGQLAEIEQERLREAEHAWAHTYGGDATKNSRWEDIKKHIAADNPSDWRLAIIEADILLEETLTAEGYEGPGVGDKLKAANPESFTAIRDAWDAHLVRNKIAHAGSDFVLTKKLAQDTIVQYERVFREFGVI